METNRWHVISLLLAPLLAGCLVVPAFAQTSPTGPTTYDLDGITMPTGMVMANDGKNMIVVEPGDAHGFALGTPFNVTTASATHSVNIPSSFFSAIQSVEISNNNTTMYLTGPGFNTINEFGISSGFQLTTSPGVKIDNRSGQGLALSDDGSRLFYGTDTIIGLALSPPFTLQSTPPVIGTFDQAESITGLAVSAEGRSLLTVTDASGGTVSTTLRENMILSAPNARPTISLIRV